MQLHAAPGRHAGARHHRRGRGRVRVLRLENPLFASNSELQNLGIDLAEFGILAIGESFAIITGGIDLGVGSLTALMVVVSGYLSHTAGLPVLLAFAVTILAGAGVGLWHGLWITRLGIAPFIITLVTFIGAAGADEAIAQTPIPISSPIFLDVASKTVSRGSDRGVIFAVIAVLAWFFLERTYLGRQVYAVGGNREAARLAGIPTNRRIVLAYVVSGSCAAVVGIIFASQLTSGTADSTTGYELIAIASAVIGGVSLIGGQGRIIGVVAGAALLVVLEQGLVAISVNAYYQSMVVAARAARRRRRRPACGSPPRAHRGTDRRQPRPVLPLRTAAVNHQPNAEEHA